MDEILDFWFGDGDPNDPDNSNDKLWFGGGAAIDKEIKQRFEPLVEQAALGKLEEWKSTARGRLAWTILLDQFTRNAYRGTPRMYGFDNLVLQSAREAIAQGQDKELPWVQRGFLYLPLMHAEDVHAQNHCVDLYTEMYNEAKGHPMASVLIYNLDFAERHAKVVRQFGRFPHRNEILTRQTTPEEREFLASKDAPF